MGYKYRQKAKREGHSLEKEPRETLTNVALERKRAIVEIMRADMEELRKKCGVTKPIVTSTLQWFIMFPHEGLRTAARINELMHETEA